MHVPTGFVVDLKQWNQKVLKKLRRDVERANKGVLVRMHHPTAKVGKEVGLLRGHVELGTGRIVREILERTRGWGFCGVIWIFRRHHMPTGFVGQQVFPQLAARQIHDCHIDVMPSRDTPPLVGHSGQRDRGHGAIAGTLSLPRQGFERK